MHKHRPPNEEQLHRYHHLVSTACVREQLLLTYSMALHNYISEEIWQLLCEDKINKHGGL